MGLVIEIMCPSALVTSSVTAQGKITILEAIALLQLKKQ